LVQLSFLVMAVSVLFATGNSNAASYRSYGYDFFGKVVPTLDPYSPERVIDVNQYAKDVRDIFITDDGRIWIADSGNSRVVILEQDGDLVDIIQAFTTDKGQDKLRAPESVFVGQDGTIYIADTGNQRVVVLDKDRSLLYLIAFTQEEIEKSDIFPEGFRFRPRSIGQGVGNNLYVICAGVYDGIMEFSEDGVFQGFIGAPKVTPSLRDVLWTRLATEEQRARRRLFLPVEFSKLDIDERGFIYTTVATTEAQEEVVKRLSPGGQDTLVRAGKLPIVGDIKFAADMDPYTGPSTLIDIVVRENGIYSVLDSKRGRVFTYDNYGNLLYVFGGPGSHQGMFNRPSAIESYRDRLFVADRGKNTITVYRPTDYAQFIHLAVHYYEHGQYDRSAEAWRKVLGLDASYEMAYIGIGRNYLLQGDFVKAMENFRLGQDRQNYSKAFEDHRSEVLHENIGRVVSAVVLLLVLIWLILKHRVPDKVKSKVNAALSGGGRVKQTIRDTLEGVSYAKHLAFHPFDGFWDLKYLGKGSVASATVLHALLVFSLLCSIYYTGFIFNTRDLNSVNVVREVAIVLATFALWCIVNWGVTTLTDGKGSFRDVFIYSTYALTPLIMMLIPTTIISNYMTVGEGYYYYLFLSIAIGWTGALLFVGTIVTHEYSVSKAVLSSWAMVVGIVLVAFIGLLFFMIIDRLIYFVIDLYNELTYRMV